MQILDAGISVISAINIRHLESLNEQVQEITGVEVHERVPDSVLAMPTMDVDLDELIEPSGEQGQGVSGKNPDGPEQLFPAGAHPSAARAGAERGGAPWRRKLKTRSSIRRSYMAASWR